MFVRYISFCFFAVSLVKCEIKKRHEDPPLQSALNTEYFGYVRGGKRVSLIHLTFRHESYDAVLVQTTQQRRLLLCLLSKNNKTKMISN